MKKALCVKTLDPFISLFNGSSETFETELVDREICEKPENNYFQFIPYASFYTVDYEQGKLNILIYKRHSKITEERLVDKISCGFGGHIDLEEEIVCSETIQEENGLTKYKMTKEDIQKTILNAAKREIKEELNIDVEFNNYNDIIYFLGDQEIEVNKVHLGASILIRVQPDEFQALVSNTNFNKEEIAEIKTLSFNFKNIIEDFDINKSFMNILKDLKEVNIESWSEVNIEHILKREYYYLMSNIKYEDILGVIINRSKEQNQVKKEQQTLQ